MLTHTRANMGINSIKNINGKCLGGVCCRFVWLLFLFFNWLPIYATIIKLRSVIYFGIIFSVFKRMRDTSEIAYTHEEESFSYSQIVIIWFGKLSQRLMENIIFKVLPSTDAKFLTGSWKAAYVYKHMCLYVHIHTRTFCCLAAITQMTKVKSPKMVLASLTMPVHKYVLATYLPKAAVDDSRKMLLISPFN